MREQYLSEIEALYINHYDKLLMYAVRILKDETLAEEAVQETFRKKPMSFLNTGTRRGG